MSSSVSNAATEYQTQVNKSAAHANSARTMRDGLETLGTLVNQPTSFPGALSLLAGGSEPLPSLLESYGFEYDNELKRFRCEEIDYAGYSGSMLFTALGNEGEDTGRRMSPERLRAGESMEAVQFTLFLDEEPEPLIAGETAEGLFDVLLAMDNIDDAEVIREDIAPSSKYVPPLSSMGARCAIDGRDAFWAATVAGWWAFTCCCSYLDYYVQGNEPQIVESTEDVSDPYAVISDASPWDIPIDDTWSNETGTL